jgi:hypothetical protein
MSVEPIAHRPVYKRIELHPVRAKELPEPVNALQELLRDAEAERIWQITRQTAMGTNQPAGEQQ